MATSDSSEFQSNQYSIVPFDGKDFDNWAFRIRTTLAELDLETILDEESDDPEWKSKDAKAKSVLVSCIADTHLHHVKGQSSSKAMMDNLASKFSPSSIPAQMSAWRKLLAMSYDGRSALVDYLTKFEAILDELESAGCLISDDYKICCILSSMPESYSRILESADSVTLDQVKSKILQSKLPTQLKADNDIRCYYCGVSGHQRWNCWKLKKKWLNEQLSTNGNGSQLTKADNPSRVIRMSIMPKILPIVNGEQTCLKVSPWGVQDSCEFGVSALLTLCKFLSL